MARLREGVRLAIALPALCAFEDQFARPDGDSNAVAGGKMAGQDAFCQGRLHQALDVLPQRPGAETSIERARRSQPLDDLFGCEVFDPLFHGESLAAFQQHQQSNLSQLRSVQRAQHQPLIEAIPQLGREGLANCALNRFQL